ncbi:uncharacterized protein LOC135576044 isoform X1 [Columba livia]|uniref:uncharacterized protein LOC135576044 isoform X1 n=1 Tax=Columba livia TaxID=8932 RepID=UPI0031BA0183
MVHGQQLFGPVRLSHRPAMKMVTLPGSAEDTTSFELGPSGRGSLPVMQWSGHHLCCPTPGLALTCSFTDHALSSDLLRVKWEYFLQGRPEADEPAWDPADQGRSITTVTFPFPVTKSTWLVLSPLMLLRSEWWR